MKHFPPGEPAENDHGGQECQSRIHKPAAFPGNHQVSALLGQNIKTIDADKREDNDGNDLLPQN